MNRLSQRTALPLVALAACIALIARRSGLPTGQLFFADSLTDRVYRNVPYRVRAAGRTTRNSNDSIYAGGGAQSTLSMKPNGRGGFIGSITLGVKKG